MLFDKLSTTNIDLSTTRNELQVTRNELQVSRNELSTACNEFRKTNTKLEQNLSTTRNDLSATRNDLSATKNELSSTRNELRETNSKLEKATTELLQLKNNLSTRSTPTHQSATPQATKRRSNPTAPPKQIEGIIPLMEKVVRPNQPRATQSSYCNNVKRMSELMKIGQLYFLNEEECFFKLHLQVNYQSLRIRLVEDLTDYRNDENSVFENEDIVLLDWSPSWYVLFVSIRKHDEKNSKGFLIDTKRSANNRLLEYDGYGDVNVGWNDYKDCNNCLLFYFTKK